MIKQIILAFFGSIFPVILFNIDRKKIIWAGFCGAIGWATYISVFNYRHSVVMASFAGAFIVGIYSEFMARKLKTPTIQFSIPGIFPLVPGITAYKTISYIVDQSYYAAYSEGIQVIVAAGAIGFGIMLSSTTFRFISKLSKLNKKKKSSESM
jgi:uncharacterized membrane protein YjjB (DUF3815 family)